MKIILAADEKWGIGRDGGLLCHLSGDLRYFKEMTLGKTVIMGRVTLESFPGGKPLPGRRNIVMTRNPLFRAEGAETVLNRNELKELIKDTDTEDVFVIGGAEIYRHFLPECDKCYVTKIYADLKADRFFEDLDADDSFKCRALSEEKEEKGIRYRFFVYERETK